MSNIPVVKFSFRSEWKVLDEALKIQPAYEAQEFESASTLIPFISNLQACLIITSLRNKNDLVQLATLVKYTKKMPTNMIIKFAVVNFSGDTQFEKTLTKLGSMELIEDKISTKGLKFKMDFWMKSINGQVKKKLTNKFDHGVKSLDANKNSDRRAIDSTPNWVDALKLKDDIWLIKNDHDCKKILSRWLVKVMGPSPYAGQWIEAGSPNLWKFELNGQCKPLFISGEGSWFLKGDQRPEFVWKENIWLLTGDSFELFYKQGEVLFSRIKLKEGSFSAAKNSDWARDKEQVIIDTFNKEFVIKNPSEVAETKENLEQDNNVYKNLQGKGKTDHLQFDPLSGESETSHLNAELLSLELDHGDHNYSSDPLSQKGKTSHESGFWGGKNSQEHETAPQLQAPVDTRPASGILSMDAHRHEASPYAGSIKKNEAPLNGLSGKGSTDKINNFMSSQENKSQADQQNKNSDQILDFNKANEIRKRTFDKDFEEVTSSASVSALLIQRSSKVPCQLDDFFERSLIFISKERGISKDEGIKIDLTFKYMNKETHLKLDGRVVGVDKDSDGVSFISVEISQESVTSFESFMRLYQVRQHNVNLFFDKVKGF